MNPDEIAYHEGVKRRPESGDATINITPAPALVQAALNHCKIPLTILPGHTVDISTLTGQTLVDLLGAVVDMAMLTHAVDTMILPSNASRLREVANGLDRTARDARVKSVFFADESLSEELIEAAETLNGVAANIEAER